MSSRPVHHALLALLLLGACNSNQQFTVIVRNVSTPGTLATDRASGAVPLSAGAFIVFRADADPTFTVGTLADSGIRLIAEDGIPSPAFAPAGVEGTEVAELPLTPGFARTTVFDIGTFSSPGGADMGPAIFPAIDGFKAEQATFTLNAEQGDRLQIVTGFLQSNDFFFAFGAGGLPLFVGAAPIAGDVTQQLVLFDAGTEADTPPGTGPDQALVQGANGVDIGPVEVVPITPVSERHPDFVVPPPEAVIQVLITAS
jgi:hypothetical protein